MREEIWNAIDKIEDEYLISSIIIKMPLKMRWECHLSGMNCRIKRQAVS